MTSTTHLTPAAIDDRTRARRALVPTAVAVAGIGSLVTSLFADNRAEAIIDLVFIPLLTAAVFGLVVARGLRHTTAGGRGILMGVIGLLTLPVAFWSGIPLVLGAAATLLGYAGKRADHGAGKAIASFVLGLLTVLGTVGLYIGDYLHTH